MQCYQKDKEHRTNTVKYTIKLVKINTTEAEQVQKAYHCVQVSTIKVLTIPENCKFESSEFTIAFHHFHGVTKISNLQSL